MSVCGYCKKQFKTLRGCAVHNGSQHLVCQVCGLVTDTGYFELRNHTLGKHPEWANFIPIRAAELIATKERP